MSTRHWQSILTFGLSVVVAVVAGCTDPGLAPERVCSADDQCDDGYACGPAGLCVVVDACEGDQDCCPGAVCFSGWCRPTTECAGGGACLGRGEVCEGDQCVAAPCGADVACADGFGCVAGRCVAGAPCGGRCSAEEVCDIVAGRCRAAACPLSCDVGWRVAVEGPSDPWSCGEPACACGTLLEVPPGRPGVDGVLLASDNGSAQLLSYEPVYGDLVASRFGDDGRRSDVVLDGAPEGEGAVGLATAYRGGVIAPGDDVGRRLAVAVGAAARWDIVYRDEGVRGLRHVRYEPASGRVERLGRLPIEGDAGRYTCVVPDGDGVRGLTFVASDAADQVSRLVAFSGVGSQMVTATVLETALPRRSERPCGGACGLSEVCVEAGGGEVCGAGLQAAGCGGACGRNAACVAVAGGAAACAPRVFARSEVDRLPFGEGLFVTCDGDVAAWYDADRGEVVVARAPFSAALRQRVDVAPGRDVGRHAAIRETSAGVVLAVRDEVAGRLRVGVAGDVLGAWRFEDVDVGGAWAKVMEVDGRVVVVHGDPAAGDVRVAAARVLGEGGCWGTASVFEDGGFAFPGGAGAGGGELFVSALRYAFEDDLDPAHGPVLTRVSMPAGACR